MKKIDWISVIVMTIGIAVMILLLFVNDYHAEKEDQAIYQEAVELYEQHKYAEAADLFLEIIDDASSLFDGYPPRDYLQFCINALKVR